MGVGEGKTGRALESPSDICGSAWDLAELKAVVDNALQQLMNEKPCLFQIDAHEVTIAHRLALYLEPSFPKWHVDIEYNRDKDVVKRMGNGEKMRPDVIVHERRKSDNNVLVIEMKKSNNREGTSADTARLAEMTSPDGRYKYQYGLMLVFGSAKSAASEQRWFRKGHEV